MAYMGTGVSLRDSIHTDSSTGISGWNTHRTALTGEFTRNGGNISGRYGEFSKDIQEYNRKIDTLSGAWQDTGMFLTPYNAGFRYTGTGDFNKWDTYSLDFDGVDDWMDTSADDTLAGKKTYSFWAKSSLDDYNGVFDHGGDRIGAVVLNWSVPHISLGVNYYRAFVDAPQQHDGEWHHWVVYFDPSDITTSKLYCDGVALGIYGTGTSGSPAAYTTGIRIGRASAKYFEGSLDEFAIFDGELSAAQVLAIYNGGTPQSLAPYSPIVWWRMGDGPLDDGNIVGNGLIGDQVNPTLGSELVLNGDMELDDNWNDLGSPTTNERSTERVYSGTYSRKCVANAGSEGLKSDTFSLVAGTVYKVSFYYYLEIAAGPTYRWIMQIKDGDGSDLDPSQSLAVTGAWTNITFYRTATATGSGSYFQVFQSLGGDSTFYLDNVSVKPVNGNAGIMKNMTASDIVADTP